MTLNKKILYRELDSEYHKNGKHQALAVDGEGAVWFESFVVAEIICAHVTRVPRSTSQRDSDTA